MRLRRPATPSTDSDDRLALLAAKLDRLESQIADLTVLMQCSESDRRTADRELRDELERGLRPLLLALVRDDAGNRRRLFALRESAEYELAYTVAEPLVTVVIPALGERAEMLINRALPSALAQTHTNLEVVIVGDAAGQALAAVASSLGDPRVRFADLTQRFVHPDPHRHWLTASTLARNEGHRLARGIWIAELDDDDALRPGAVSSLLALAREQRLEVAYGLIEQHDLSGGKTLLGRFPPASRDPDWRGRGLPFQHWDGRASGGSVALAGLRFFARELVAADVPAPGDFFRVERMVRAGVRFGMLQEVVYDYYPSQLWDRAPAEPAVSSDG